MRIYTNSNIKLPLAAQKIKKVMHKRFTGKGMLCSILPGSLHAKGNGTKLQKKMHHRPITLNFYELFSMF